jgi:signal transduction histidine kinase/CheY-like chemotaxis protein
VAQSTIGRIMRAGQPELINDLRKDTAFRDPAWAQRHGLTAFAGFPLIVEGEPVGVLGLLSRRPISEGIFQTVQTIANGIALGIEHKEAEAALLEQTDMQETINRTAQIVAAELDLQMLVQAVTDAATDLTGAQFGSFFYNVTDADGESYMLYSISGVPAERFSNFPMPRATELFGPTFRGECTIRIADVRKDPRFGRNAPHHGMPEGHLPVVSYLAVPVISRSGDVIGGLFFGHEEPGVFSERDERVVEALAAQASVAMDNARLYEAAAQEQAKAEAAAAENERLYREAQEANRIKDEFLATVSHELRTPLTAILGWTTMLASGDLDPAATARAIETIDRNTRAQAQIVEDLLDISRIISGKLRLNVQLMDLASVVEAAVETMRPAAAAKNVRLQLLLDPQAGPVSGDPDRLQQVVWNLVSNSVKFTPKGGRVQIRLERVNSHVEIVVSDTGKGIVPQFLPHVFDRFRQADSSTSRHFGGLGLGLAIVRQIVEMHGGSVAVDSPGEDQGTTFTVSLPLAVVNSTTLPNRVHPRARNGAVPFDCPPELTGHRILVVDDEEDTRSLLKFILEACHAEVQTVDSVDDALDAIDEFNPDLLISDIGMPGADGYDLIRLVRDRETRTGRLRLPAIALTAFARVEDRMRALASGFQMHIPKPVEPAELVTVIASLMGKLR